MEFGRRLNEKESHEIIADFLKANADSNKSTEIDTAFMYQRGKTETYIGKVNKTIVTPNKGLIATKAFPKHENGLSDAGIRKQFQISLSRLQTKSVDLFYLHWPDYTVPIEESLKTVNDLYNKGKFKRFGLSNYSAWQVTEIWYLCDKMGYIKPTVYQGMYNAITRDVEDELFPCLRRFGISFNAYNPLAGGLLSGKHKFEQLETDDIEKGGRFHGKAGWAIAYKERFWQKSKFDAIELIREALKQSYGVSDDGTLKVGLVEASLRWLTTHSALKKDDGVIMGPSTVPYYHDNLKALECADDLDANVVKAIDNAWKLCKGDCPVYFR
eukprot:256323_1